MGLSGPLISIIQLTVSCCNSCWLTLLPPDLLQMGSWSPGFPACKHAQRGWQGGRGIRQWLLGCLLDCGLRVSSQAWRFRSIQQILCCLPDLAHVVYRAVAGVTPWVCLNGVAHAGPVGIQSVHLNSFCFPRACLNQTARRITLQPLYRFLGYHGVHVWYATSILEKGVMQAGRFGGCDKIMLFARDDKKSISIYSLVRF